MNKYLAALLGVLTVYEELSTGGAKAEADKLIAVLVQTLTATTPAA